MDSEYRSDLLVSRFERCLVCKGSNSMQHTKYVDLAGHNIKQGYRLPLWEEGMEGLSTLLAENTQYYI